MLHVMQHTAAAASEDIICISLKLSHQLTVPVSLNKLVKGGPLQLPAGRESTIRGIDIL